MKYILITSLIYLASFNNATAQRSYVRKAVKDDIERKQEQKHQGEKAKGEKAVDERLDAWDEADKKGRAKIQPFPTMSMTMVMEYPNKPKNNGSIQYYYKDFDCASVMSFDKNKGGMDRMIMNFKEGKSVMLMTDKKGKKTGMKMELKSFDWVAKSAVKKDQAMLEKGEAEIKATDEYKTIEGYKCRKYIYENDKYISELWVTNDNKLDYVKMNNALFNVFANSKDPNQNAYYKAGMKGFTIQTHMMPKDKRMQECIMTMKDIKLGSVPAEMFSTAGYEITDMPSIRNMWDSFKEEN